MLIVKSIQELREVSEKHNITDSESKLLDVVILNTKYVTGSGNIVTLKDAIEFVDDEKLPIVKESLRKDVYDYYNAQLTNYINFKLINAVCDIATNENHEIFQYPIFTESYMLDREELLEMGESETRIAVILKEIDWKELYELADKLANAEEAMVEAPGDNMDVLTFAYPVSVTKTDRLKLPTNERLVQGHLLTTNKPEEHLSGTGIKVGNLKDVIMFIGDDTYIIRHNFLKMATIRKSNLIECFAQNIHKY